MMAKKSLFVLAWAAVSATAQTPPGQISALQAKVESLSTELRTLEKILAMRGLDIERERHTLALQDSTFQIPVEGTAILGDPKAPVTVVLFTDLQCPYCAQMLPALKSLHAEHPKALRVSFRHFPLVSIHDKAMDGHLALWAAGRQGKLWDYYFRMAPGFRALSDSALVAAAKDLKLDLVKFDAERHSEAARKSVEMDMKLGESVGVQGTPSLYLEGKSIRNPGDIALACAKFEDPAKK